MWYNEADKSLKSDNPTPILKWHINNIDQTMLPKSCKKWWSKAFQIRGENQICSQKNTLSVKFKLDYASYNVTHMTYTLLRARRELRCILEHNVNALLALLRKQRKCSTLCELASLVKWNTGIHLSIISITN